MAIKRECRETMNSENQLVTDGGRDTEDAEYTSGDETAERLRIATQPTRRKILLKILGHPEEAPSVAELLHHTANVNNRTAIESHLENLAEVGLVKSIQIEKGRRSRDLPHKFWTFTEEGREFLEQHELIPKDSGPMKQVYERIEKNEKIERYERADRPGDYSAEDTDPELGEEINSVLKKYKQTGDERQAGRELAELEEDEDSTQSMGVLEQLVQSVQQVEARISRLEQQVEEATDRIEGQVATVEDQVNNVADVINDGTAGEEKTLSAD
jgi:hypothetical protein